MRLKIADWLFDVDTAATFDRTNRYSKDHCTCGYCKNFYDTVELTYPGLCEFLGEFGVYVHGPCEVMPFEPDFVLVAYRLDGTILQWGTRPMYADGIAITAEEGENDTFLLWVGEMELPWVQEEAMEDVVSPANLPEFLERMQNMWLLRHGEEIGCS